MHGSVTRLKLAAACAVLPLAVAMTAQSAFATMAGTYTGTNNEGYPVQVVVASVNGGLAVTGISDEGAVYCDGLQAATYGVGVGLAGQPIVKRRATIDLLVTSLYFHSDLKFGGGGLHGKIQFAVPLFNKTKEPPKMACAAKTMKQTFTATIGGATFHAPPAGTAYAVPAAVLK